MIKQYAVIYLGAGVTVFIPVDVRYKHHTKEENDAVLEALAQKLGGTFQYLETVEEQP